MDQKNLSAKIHKEWWYLTDFWNFSTFCAPCSPCISIMRYNIHDSPATVHFSRAQIDCLVWCVQYSCRKEVKGTLAILESAVDASQWEACWHPRISPLLLDLIICMPISAIALRSDQFRENTHAHHRPMTFWLSLCGHVSFPLHFDEALAILDA